MRLSGGRMKMAVVDLSPTAANTIFGLSNVVVIIGAFLTLLGVLGIFGPAGFGTGTQMNSRKRIRPKLLRRLPRVPAQTKATRN